MKSLISVVIFTLTVMGVFVYAATITVTPTELNGFTYVEGHGPSASQSFTVSATGLNPGQAIHIVTAEYCFEVCLTESGDYSGYFSLILYADSSGNLAPTSVCVRLKKDLSAGECSEYLYVRTSYLDTPFVSTHLTLSGSVTEPTLPVELSHFSATMTAQNYVQLTWVSQTETNLMGYNVYRSDRDDLGSAAKISDLIGATNTSNAQTYIYYDMELDQEGTYYYWLQNVDMDGTSGFHGPVSLVFSAIGDIGSPAPPSLTRLWNAYPNPFNPSTTIRYQLESAGHVKIDIYNIRGQILRSFERSHTAAGHYGLLWDGCDSSGKPLPSDLYLYRMTSGGYSSVKRVVLQK